MHLDIAMVMPSGIALPTTITDDKAITLTVMAFERDDVSTRPNPSRLGCGCPHLVRYTVDENIKPLRKKRVPKY